MESNIAFEGWKMRTSLIEDFIDKLVASGEPNDGFIQTFVAKYVGLDLDSLTQSEIEYIEREVSRRILW